MKAVSITKAEIKQAIEFLEDNNSILYVIDQEINKHEFHDMPYTHKVAYLIKENGLKEIVDKYKKANYKSKEELRNLFREFGLVELKKAYEERLNRLIKVKVEG